MLHRASGIFAATCAAVVLAGCSSVSCGANSNKLMQLRAGMSRDQADAVMGCSGKLVSEPTDTSGRFATVEWPGPDSLLFSRTHVVFLDGGLYTYSTQKRGGF